MGEVSKEKLKKAKELGKEKHSIEQIPVITEVQAKAKSFRLISSHSPKSKEFKALNDMVQTAKKLVATIGVLSTPNMKQGKVLLPATSEMAKQFYVFHEIETSCQGQKLMVLLTYIVLRDNMLVSKM